MKEGRKEERRKGREERGPGDGNKAEVHSGGGGQEGRKEDGRKEGRKED